jgi:ABC-2 type transport system permease protein
MGVPLTPHNILILTLALIGGLCTYSGVFVLTSAIAFFTVKGLDWIYIFTNVSYQATRIPMEYMPRVLKNTFIFVVPMFVVSYYPAAVICGWGESAWKGYMALPAGLAFMGISLLAWRIGVRFYKSTGS